METQEGDRNDIKHTMNWSRRRLLSIINGREKNNKRIQVIADFLLKV